MATSGAIPAASTSHVNGQFLTDGVSRRKPRSSRGLLVSGFAIETVVANHAAMTCRHEAIAGGAGQFPNDAAHAFFTAADFLAAGRRGGGGSRGIRHQWIVSIFVSPAGAG